MVSVYDVPATELIVLIAQDLKGKVECPEWTHFVKSGTARERAPQSRDWYYVRMASILYRVFKKGPLGTESLRTYYGGRKNRGVKPHRFKKASGKVIRTCLQQLEKQGYIKKEKKGRGISPQGHKYLHKKSKEVFENLKSKPKKERVVKRLDVGAAKKAPEEGLRKKRERKGKKPEKK